ncbi:MAG: hypothetical protein AAGK02_12745 [Pseudomonadota bacterium]
MANKSKKDIDPVLASVKEQLEGFVGTVVFDETTATDAEKLKDAIFQKVIAKAIFDIQTWNPEFERKAEDPLEVTTTFQFWVADGALLLKPQCCLSPGCRQCFTRVFKL